jgi:hypothetical protein
MLMLGLGWGLASKSTDVSARFPSFGVVPRVHFVRSLLNPWVKPHPTAKSRFGPPTRACDVLHPPALRATPFKGGQERCLPLASR